ncbi:unnamed protein product [Phytophthora fragariaefolia]|uniref:Unnamed protein product n=1 Tax=Phytophthora fragariaefolia TaxID=1490495 RepID=A0A9W6Y7G8_9STRA|nr:unnamed protein product [Phytophthora fragariaefolia]
MDDDTACTQGTVTIAVGGTEMSSSMQVQPSDESVADVRQAVAAQVYGELVARDEERAEHYVSTVRPALAAQRYVYARDDDNGDAQGGDDATKCKVMDDMVITTSTTMEMATTEESDRAGNAVAVTEEGDTATAMPTVTDDEKERSANLKK